jgi:hypothetical protein
MRRLAGDDRIQDTGWLVQSPRFRPGARRMDACDCSMLGSDEQALRVLRSQHRVRSRYFLTSLADEEKRSESVSSE